VAIIKTKTPKGPSSKKEKAGLSIRQQPQKKPKYKSLHPIVIEKEQYQQVVDTLNFVCQVFREDNATSEPTAVRELYYERLGELDDALASFRRAGRTSPELRRTFLDALLRVAILESGLVSNPDSGATKTPERGYFVESGPLPEEALLNNKTHNHVKRETVLFLPRQETIRRGRPRKEDKSKRLKLRPVLVKLSEEEFERLEKLRRHTTAMSSVETIRAALRVYEAIVEAVRRGKDVVFEDPENRSKRAYLKLA